MEQLISEFHAKAQEEVAAVHQACALCKRQGTLVPDEDPNKSLYKAKTDAEETPKKQTKSTPVSAAPTMIKPPTSAAVGKAPKGTSINEVKGLDDDELDYDDDVEIDDTGSRSSQTQETPKDENPGDLEKHSDQQCCASNGKSTEHKGNDHSDHKKSRGRSRSKSRSRSPYGFCSPPH